MSSSKRTSAGSLFVVVAPSGAGKSTLVNALLEHDSSIQLSISCTTRQPRQGEQDGKEYYFLSEGEFLTRRAQGEFLESAEVYGNYYGTSSKVIASAIQSGSDVLLEIDWQGARQVKALFPDAVMIFILPPSILTLEARLKKRGLDEPEVVERRMGMASKEIKYAAYCEYVIINEDIATALSELRSIVVAARLRFRQQSVRHTDVFDELGLNASNGNS